MKNSIISSKDNDRYDGLRGLINMLFPDAGVSRVCEYFSRSDDYSIDPNLNPSGVSGGPDQWSG